MRASSDSLRAVAQARVVVSVATRGDNEREATMSNQQQDQSAQPEQPQQRQDAGSAGPATPLSELDAQRAHEDALRNRRQDVSEVMMAGAHGRVEEETRLLTERLTREEQARRRALVTTPLVIAPPAPLRRLPTPLPIRAMLVALNGAAYPERALPAAVALARLTGGALALGACVTSPRRLESPGPVIEEVIGQHLDAQGAVRDRALKTALLDARTRVLAYVPNVRAALVYTPDIADGLLTLEQAQEAQVIVMASHARVGAERVALGSVADEVVRRGFGQTLIVPPLAPDAQLGGLVFERALAPLDGSTTSEQTLAVLQPLTWRDPQSEEGAQHWLRSLTLLYVAQSRAQLHDGEVYLREVREALLRQATAPTEIITQVELGSAPGAIVARVTGATNALGMPSNTPEERRAARHDLIVMATHGRGGIGRWFYGSVASYVLAHSDAPILLTHSSSEA